MSNAARIEALLKKNMKECRLQYETDFLDINYNVCSGMVGFGSEP
jgi:hypothetical protein